MRVLTLACALALAASPAFAQTPHARDRFDRVVIDAGHGGDDQGAEGPAGLVEKELVLDLAQRLAKKLRARGIAVSQTRTSDAFMPLDERTRIANAAAGADLFISIHANASRAASVRGIETFFASPEASDEAAEELARAENAAFGAGAAKLAEGDPVLAILGDLLATQHLADSQAFARLAQGELARGAARSRGVKQAPFVVLMGVRMPAVLVEVGFITNPSDEKALRKGAERERIASGLARAIAAFRAQQDARVGMKAASGGE